MVRLCSTTVLLLTALGELRSLAWAGVDQRAAELVARHAELKGTSATATNELQTSIASGRIPSLIHQTWKTHDLPQRFKEWSETWILQNPGWVRVLWSDDENRLLVKELYPSFLHVYDSFTMNISRADAILCWVLVPSRDIEWPIKIRPLILHRYGGVYADLDSQALRPLAPLLEGEKVILAQMGEAAAAHSIPNAFLASAVGQEFWTFFVGRIAQVQLKVLRQNHKLRIEAIAGPDALKTSLEAYGKLGGGRAAEIRVLPPGLIFPVDWSAKRHGTVPAVCDFGGHPQEFDTEACISKHLGDAYSVQWWAHSWGDDTLARLEGFGSL